MKDIFLLDIIKRPIIIGIPTALTYWVVTLPWIGLLPFVTQFYFATPWAFVWLIVGVWATGLLGNWLWRIYQPKKIWLILGIDVPVTGAIVYAAYSYFGINSPIAQIFPYFVFPNYDPASIFGLILVVIAFGLIANYPQLKKQGYVKAF